MRFLCWGDVVLFPVVTYDRITGEINASDKRPVVLPVLTKLEIEMFKPKAKSKVLVDYKKKDYRGFIFVVHDEHGMMLLRCTRKKSKPPHWQLPGGHVDEEEFVSAGKY